MSNKNKRLSIRKDFLKDFEEKDYFSCYEKAESIIKLYNEQERDSIEYCIDLYNIAYIQQILNKYSISMNYYKKILKILGKNKYDTNNKQDLERIKIIIDTENSLGVCYAKNTKKQDLAMNCFERALSLLDNYCLDNKELKANILHNIGCIEYDKQNYDDAIYIFLDSLEYRKSIKKRDINYVDTLNFLGYCYQETKHYEDAINYFNQALNIIKGLFGINSEEYIANTYYKAHIYTIMENYDEAVEEQYSYLSNYKLAIESYREASYLIEQKLGDKHPYFAESLSKLSEVYLKIDEPEKALEVQLKSLNIIKEIVGEKHMFYANSLKKVGDIYYILEDFEKCLFYYEIENKIKEDVIGVYNEEYIDSLLNLVNIFIKTNSLDKQEQIKDKLLKMLDFDLSKNSYENAMLILCKIYMHNNLTNSLFDIYEKYSLVNEIDTFDDMIKKAKNIEEDIINKSQVDERIYKEKDNFKSMKNIFYNLKNEVEEDNQEDNKSSED